MKPIFTKFFGDIERSKSLMPKARARIKHLAQKGGEFFGGVRIDRSLWDGVEITVYEYADLYVVRIGSPVGGGREFPQGGVWLVPYDDNAPGGYGANQFDVIDNKTVDVDTVTLYETRGAWSHKSLVPKDANRGSEGPSDVSTLPAALDEPVQFNYGYFVNKDEGVGRRVTTGEWHEPSQSYISWEIGFDAPWNPAGYTAADITYGRAFTFANKYFFNPAGQQLYWGGSPLGKIPDPEDGTQARYILGAGIIGGSVGGLTAVVVCADFMDATVATSCNVVNNINRRKVTVWRRSFPGNTVTDYQWPDNSLFHPIDNPGGWRKIGEFDPPTKWDIQYYTNRVTSGVFGQPHRNYYCHYPDFNGGAAWNDQPPRDETTDELLYYEFSGPMMISSVHEYDTNDPPLRVPDNQDDPIPVDSVEDRIANKEVVSFYTIKIDPSLESLVVEWEDVAKDPLEVKPANESSLGIAVETIPNAIKVPGGWVKTAVDYRDGEKVYYEIRKFVNDPAYFLQDLYNTLSSIGSNQIFQFRFNNHTFTGSYNKYFRTLSDTDPCLAPYALDCDWQEVFPLQIDMKQDRAWLCSYFTQKRGLLHNGCNVEYYGTVSNTQRCSHYWFNGEELVKMFDEVDGEQAMPLPFNLEGDIATPTLDNIDTLQDEAAAYATTVLNYYTTNHDMIRCGGMLSHYIGWDASFWSVRASSGTQRTLQMDAPRIQNSHIGSYIMHDGNIICGKKESTFGFSGADSGWETTPSIFWYFTGIAYDIEATNVKAIVWDSLNGNDSYIDTFNMPSNDSDCDWIGLIG